ncbi:MAG: hypothetical protein GX963_05720 [Bacteroidales bacterium]|nr:hypothetical protein [Bacteroidales bacterium]
MYRITVSDEIKKACPQFHGAAVYASVKNTSRNEELWKQIAVFTHELKKEITIAEIKLHPAIKATREVYKTLGKDPNRYRPSSEALHRRILRDIPLYQISTLVDLINFVSLKSGYSIGGFDADCIIGNELELGVGKYQEPFEAIGRGEMNVEFLPLYRDAKGGIGTPTSDHERSKISLSTQHLLILINGYSGETGLKEAVELTLDLLRKYADASEEWVNYYE